jgi:tetratricopeptide (TPR) repeat protein
MTSASAPNTINPEIIRLKRVLTRARQANDQTVILEGLTDLGRAYMDTGDTPKALTQFDEALTLAQEMKNLEQEAHILGLKGMGLKQIGNYQFALQSFRKSHQLAKKIGHRLLVCDSLTQIGILQAEIDDNLKAISSLERALGESMQLEDPLRRMRIAGTLGKCFNRVESYDKSLEYYALALETACKLGDSGAKCAYLIAMGNSLLMAEAHEEAIQNLEEALQLADEAKNQQAEIRALRGLMIANAEIGKTRLAIMYGEQAVQLAGEMQDWESELNLLYLLSDVLSDQSQFERAIITLEQALLITREMEAWDWQIQLLNQIGDIYFNLDALPKSLEAFEQALQLAEKVQDRSQQVNLLGYISELRAGLEDFEGALTAAQQSLSIAKQDEDTFLLGEANIILAFAYRDVGEINLAIQSCQTAIETYQELGVALMINQAKAVLAEMEILR